MRPIHDRSPGRRAIMIKSREEGTSWFTQFLIRENGLDRNGFEEWAFQSGMLFSATTKWWGDRGKRVVPHEGVDFCLYVDRQGRVFQLEKGTRIPVMYAGVVVNIIDDFLGKSVVVAHDCLKDGAPPLLTIYGHTAPLSGLTPGKSVEAGEVIATIAFGQNPLPRISPHLHVSVGFATGIVPYEKLDWKTMGVAVALSNPLDLLVEGRYCLVEGR